MKKNDLKLLLLFLIPAVIWILVHAVRSEEGNTVVVKVDGSIAETYPLSEDMEAVIEGADGGYNRLVIEDGSACLLDADCPDQLCVWQGTISHAGESIICLPHKMVVEIINEQETEENEVDIIAK